jgi:hypothetical protein
MKASTMIMFPYVATSVWDVFVSPVADQATEDCEVWESPDSEKSGCRTELSHVVRTPLVMHIGSVVRDKWKRGARESEYHEERRSVR